MQHWLSQWVVGALDLVLMLIYLQTLIIGCRGTDTSNLIAL